MKKQVNLILNHQWESYKELCEKYGLEFDENQYKVNVLEGLTIKNDIAENLEVGEIIEPSIFGALTPDKKLSIGIYEMFGIRFILENRYENEEGLTLVFGIPKPATETPISHFQ